MAPRGAAAAEGSTSIMKLPATLDVVIEVPQWSFVKRKGDGRIDYIAPLPSPFGGYGSVPYIPAEDGAPPRDRGRQGFVLPARLPQRSLLSALAGRPSGP